MRLIFGGFALNRFYNPDHTVTELETGTNACNSLQQRALHGQVAGHARQQEKDVAAVRRDDPAHAVQYSQGS